MGKNVNFVKLSPAENTTVLITNPVADEKNRVLAAQTAMAYTHLLAEQVGFFTAGAHNLRETVARLDMTGGEFCGNAVLSAAALCRWQGIAGEAPFYLDASGVSTSLAVQAKETGFGRYWSWGEMPVDYALKPFVLETTLDGIASQGQVVELPGISHLMLEVTDSAKAGLGIDDVELPGTDEATKAENAARERPMVKQILRQLMRQETSDAYGVIFYFQRSQPGDGKVEAGKTEANKAETGKAETGKADNKIEAAKARRYGIVPWVHVPAAESLVRERGCGSGTLALGYLIAERAGGSLFSGDISQPGGIIRVQVDLRGPRASIATEVCVTCHGAMVVGA